MNIVRTTRPLTVRRDTGRLVPLGPFARSLIGLAMIALSACGLPAQGPSTQTVIASGAEQQYELVTLSRATAQRLAQHGWAGFPAEFLRAPQISTGYRLGVGDRLNVTIFEAGPDGLFSSPDGNSTVTIPNLQVGPDGTITLPYAGQIVVTNLPPAEVERAIVAALQGKAVEPQAVVTVTESANNAVTVVGDVARPAQVPLSVRGERLSAVLAAVGGSNFPAHETQVAITRQGQSAAASLQRILDDPAQDIALRANDRITFTRRATSYTIMGSVNLPSNVTFTEPRISLLEAIGKSSGLLDERADSGGVFLFRREPANILHKHGVEAKPWWQETGNAIPTVYSLDFSQPEAFFIAQTVQMHHGDIIYVASAGSVQLSKVLRLFNLAAGAARTTVDLSQ